MGFDPVSYAMGKKAAGGGATVVPLSVTANGTYQETGKAFSPVAVRVRDVNAEDKDINFYDVDGVRLFSYTRDEFATLSALPTAPDVPELHLRFSGWNWTIEEINAQPGYVEVGALYDPDDCDCALVIEPDRKAYEETILRFFTNGNTVEVDWGDGSEPERFDDVSTQTVATHTHVAGRPYRIRLMRIAGENKIIVGGNANAQIFYGNSTDPILSAVKELYAGSNCSLRTVVLGQAVVSRCVLGAQTQLNTQFIYAARDAKILILSRDSDYARSFDAYARAGNTICPAGNTRLPFNTANGFRNYAGGKITIPNGVKSIANRAIMNAPNLKELHIPASVETIAQSGLALHDDNAFFPILKIWFYGLLPPILSASDSITCRMNLMLYVPFGSLAAYLSGTNWPDPASYTYRAFAEFADGATLPEVDSSGAYRVTWYANESDLAAEKNPITVGNGKMVYCTYEEVST